MTDALAERLQHLIVGQAARVELVWLFVLAVLLVAAGILRRYLQPPRRRSPQGSPMDFDLTTLELPAAEGGPPQLRVYHVPARLAFVIVAPLGRKSEVPEPDDVVEILDRAVPGLGKVIGDRPPVVRVWPVQLSADGFQHALARHVKLPRDDSGASQWCLLAGIVRLSQGRYMLGLALHAAEANTVGIVGVESEHKWLDILRLSP